MTTLPGRPATAVVIVDVQAKVMESAHEREAVVGAIGRLVARARAAGTPIVWVQHEAEDLVRGEPAWEIVGELDPRPDERRIAKRYGDAFEETELEAALAASRAGRLVVAGAQTDACIRCTIHGALTRGYDVTLVADAHSTEDLSAWGAPPPGQVIAHTNLYWRFQSAPGRACAVAKADEVVLA